MLMIDVPEAEYIVFEHGPFDYEQENRSVEEKIEQAMAAFDFMEHKNGASCQTINKDFSKIYVLVTK